MKKDFNTPLTEVVILNIDAILEDGQDMDSTGKVKPETDPYLGNEGIFDEADVNGSSKSLWDN